MEVKVTVGDAVASEEMGALLGFGVGSDDTGDCEGEPVGSEDTGDCVVGDDVGAGGGATFSVQTFPSIPFRHWVAP